MLPTACASHSSTGQSNVRSFGSSLAVNPAHAYVEEVNKSTWNNSTRNRNILNICLVLASLRKFSKVNCPLFTRKKTKTTLYWSHLEQFAVIRETESRMQGV